MPEKKEKNTNLTPGHAPIDRVDHPTTAKTLENIRGLLEKNLELSEETFKRAKYIKRYVIMSQVLGTIKILLIVVPLVIGILYLPPLLKNIQPILKDVKNAYGELLGTKKQVDSVKDAVDINKLPTELRKFLE